MRKILLVLLVIFLAIQFFKPEKNIAAAPSPNHISSLYPVPDDVNQLLSAACNDCHSNTTKYPWYSKIQPVAWWLDDHIKEGKHELNFDEFATYSLRRQYHKLEECEEMIEKNEMPLTSYTIIHKDAKLNETQKQLLMSWSKGIRKQMEAKYPIDSLIKKK